MIALSLAVAAAAAAAAAPDTFVTYLHGRELGRETVTREVGPDGTTMRGEARVESPAGTLTLRQTLSVDPEGALRSYALEVATPMGPQQLRAIPAEGSIRFEAGPVEAPLARQEREVSGKWALVDNNLGSHLDLLTRRLTLPPGGSETWTIVVPQAFLAAPGKISRLDDGAGMRRYRLELAGLALEMDARPEDGGLLEARVPLQDVAYRREGYAPEPPKDEGADPRQKDASIETPEGKLPAEIVTPKGDGPFPAVVMLSGSGPNDRDETIGPNKPFRDLALALADRGIASIRFDKATRAGIWKGRPETLASEYDDDALRALELLAAAPGIDRKRIFVLGHSLGAGVAPRIATRAGEKVAGAILLAPPVRRADVLLVAQMRTQALLLGKTEAEAAEQTHGVEARLAEIAEGKGGDAPFLGASPTYWRDFLSLDVAKDLASGTVPTLVLQGENDVQIDVAEDFGKLRAAVGDAKGRVTYRSFPGLNHLFMQVDGKSTGAEYGVPGRVSSEVADAIATWIASSAKDIPASR